MAYKAYHKPNVIIKNYISNREHLIASFDGGDTRHTNKTARAKKLD
jgi:hypothetical protein